MEPSVQGTAREVSSLYVVPTITLEDSDAALYSFIGSVAICFQHRPAASAPRTFLADIFQLLSQQHMCFTPMEQQIPLSARNLVVVVRHESTAFGLLTAPETLFSRPRLERIALYSGWLLQQSEAADMARHVMHRLTPETQKALNELSPRERDVLRMLVQGQAIAEIAAQLGCEKSTVHSHCHHIYLKLGAKGRAETIAIGRAAGLQYNT